MQSFTISPKRSYKFWRIFALLFAFIASADSANLSDVNIKGDKNGLEILFLLDSAFEGRVSKNAGRDFTTLTFNNLNFNKNKLQTKSALIKNIEIFKQNNGVVVVFGEANFDLNFDLSVQNSANAIKVQVTPKASIAGNILADSALNSQNLASQNLSQNLPQNQSSPANSLEQSISAIKAQNNLLPQQSVERWRYIAVVAILLALVIALFIIKRRVKKAQDSAISLFQKSTISVAQSIQIDAKNKILIIESQTASYILFVGVNSAFIIDKIPKSEVANLIRQHKIAHLLKNYEQLQKA